MTYILYKYIKYLFIILLLYTLYSLYSDGGYPLGFVEVGLALVLPFLPIWGAARYFYNQLEKTTSSAFRFFIHTSYATILIASTATIINVSVMDDDPKGLLLAIVTSSLILLMSFLFISACNRMSRVS